MRWCNSVAFVGTAALLGLAGAVPVDRPGLALPALALPFLLLGANAGGFPKAAMLVSGRHAPTVMAIFQVSAGLGRSGKKFSLSW